MIIKTKRFDLVPMSAAFMRAMLDGDVEGASTEIGCRVPDNWELTEWIMEIRLKRLLEDPSMVEWQLRVIVPQDDGDAIGHLGFHSAPGSEALAELAPGGVEIGYSVFNPNRRKYCAYEAGTAMIEWAHKDKGVNHFIARMDPDNVPSIGLASKLGFVHKDLRIDKEGEPEKVMELVYQK